MNKAKKITIGTLMAGALLCGGLALGGCGGTSYTLSVEGNATAGGVGTDAKTGGRRSDVGNFGKSRVCLFGVV